MRKNQSMITDTEMTQMIKSVHKAIKPVTTVFLMFKQLEKSLKVSKT